MRLVHLKDKVGVGCDCLMQGEQEWKEVGSGEVRHVYVRHFLWSASKLMGL